MSVYEGEFPLDTEGQENAPLPVMGIIYILSLPRGKKMIEQRFNYAVSTAKEMTDFFETRVETESHVKTRISLLQPLKEEKKALKRRKYDESNSSEVESSEESFLNHWPVRKYNILHGENSHTTGNCKDQWALIW